MIICKNCGKTISNFRRHIARNRCSSGNSKKRDSKKERKTKDMKRRLNF